MAGKYALALHGLVLENADTIFEHCKQHDPNANGVLEVSNFCHAVSIVLGIPKEDASLLLSDASKESGLVPYATWLMQLQAKNVSNVGGVDRSGEEGRTRDSINSSYNTDVEAKRNESGEEWTIFDDTFSDDEDNREVVDTRAMSSVVSLVDEKGLVTTPGREVVVVQATPQSIGTSVSPQSNRSQKRDWNGTGSEGHSSTQHLYEQLWARSSKDTTFRLLLENVETTLRLEKQGRASHAQLARAVGQLMEQTQKQLFDSFVAAQNETGALVTEKHRLEKSLQVRQDELNVLKRRERERRKEVDQTQASLVQLQQVGQEMLGQSEERKVALQEMKKAHAETLSRTGDISEGIQGAVSTIRRLTADCSTTQANMEKTVQTTASKLEKTSKAAGALHLFSVTKSIEKLGLVRALHRWKLGASKIAGMSSRKRIQERLERSQRLSREMEENLKKTIAKRRQMDSLHHFSRANKSWVIRMSSRALQKWRHATGMSAAAARQTLKSTVRDLMGKYDAVVKERDELDRRFQETAASLHEKLSKEVEHHRAALVAEKTRGKAALDLEIARSKAESAALEKEARLNAEANALLSKRIELQEMETEKWKAAHDAFQRETSSIQLSAEEENTKLRIGWEELSAENGNLKARVIAADKRVRILEQTLEADKESSRKKLDLLMRKTAEQVEVARANASGGVLRVSLDSRTEVLKAYDSAAKAAAEAKLAADTVHSRQQLELIREETTDLLASQELMREEMAALRKEKMELDLVENEEREQAREEVATLTMKLQTSERERKKLLVEALAMKREVAETRAHAESKTAEIDEWRVAHAKNAHIMQRQDQRLKHLQFRHKKFPFLLNQNSFFENAMAVYLKTFLKKVVHRRLAAAMSTWRSLFWEAHAEHLKRQHLLEMEGEHVEHGRLAARRVLKRWEAKNKLRAWRKWMEFNDYIQRNRFKMREHEIRQEYEMAAAQKIAKKVFMRISKRALTAAWHSWTLFSRSERKRFDELERAKMMAKKVMLRINHRQLMQGWTAWKVFLKSLDDQEVSVKIAKRVMARLLNQKMHFAFNTWHRHAVVSTLYIQHRNHLAEGEAERCALEEQNKHMLGELEEKHERNRKRLLSRLILRVWTIRHQTFRQERRLEAFAKWKSLYNESKHHSLLDIVENTKMQVSAALTYRGMIRYMKQRIRHSFNKWLAFNNVVNEEREKIKIWAARLQNQTLGKGFHSWKYMVSEKKQLRVNINRGYKILYNVFLRRKDKFLASGFRKWVMFSMNVLNFRAAQAYKKAQFDHAQRFIVSKVRDYLHKRVGHSFRHWSKLVAKWRRTDIQRKRACQLIEIKLERVLIEKKRCSFAYWLNMTKGMKIQEIRVNAATKFIGRCVRNYIKERYQTAFLHWQNIIRGIKAQEAKVEGATRFIVAQIHRNYYRKLKTKFLHWSNMTHLMGVKNMEFKSAVRYIVTNIQRAVRTKLLSAFRRWVEESRGMAIQEKRHNDAVRFVVTHVRKYINARMAKAFNVWQQFCMSALLEEQRNMSNAAAMAARQQHQENLVAARFIAMIVSKEKAALQGAWRIWMNVAYYSKIQEAERKLAEERKQLEQTHAEKMMLVTVAHAQSMQEAKLAATKARTVALLRRLENDNVGLMLQIGMDAFKMRVAAYKSARTRSAVILMRYSGKWKMRMTKVALSCWSGALAKFKLNQQTARYVLSCLKRSRHLQLRRAIETWRRNAQLQDIKYNIQITHARNMFSKKIMAISRSQRRAFDLWVSFSEAKEVELRTSTKVKTLEEEARKNLEEFEAKEREILKKNIEIADELRRTAEEEANEIRRKGQLEVALLKEESEQELASMKREYESIELELKKNRDKYQEDTSRLEEDVESEHLKAKTARVYMTIASFSTRGRKKHLTKAFLQWRFASNAIAASIKFDDEKQRLEHEKIKLEQVTDELNSRVESVQVVLEETTTQMKEEHQDQFQTVRRQAIGNRVLRSMQAYRVQRMMRSMNVWKSVIHRLQLAETNWRHGSHQMFKTIASVMRVRVHRSFHTWRKKTDELSIHEAKRIQTQSGMTHMLNVALHRMYQKLVFRGFRSWLNFCHLHTNRELLKAHEEISLQHEREKKRMLKDHDSQKEDMLLAHAGDRARILKEKNEMEATLTREKEHLRKTLIRRGASRRIWKSLNIWKHARLAGALGFWKKKVIEHRYDHVVVSRLFQSLVQFEEHKVSRAFHHWVDMTVVKEKFHRGTRGSRAATKIFHLFSMRKKMDMAFGFRLWVTHTHLVHHIILEKSFADQVDVVKLQLSSVTKLSDFKHKSLGLKSICTTISRVHVRKCARAIRQWKSVVASQVEREVKLARVYKSFTSRAKCSAWKVWITHMYSGRHMDKRSSVVTWISVRKQKHLLKMAWNKWHISSHKTHVTMLCKNHADAQNRQSFLAKLAWACFTMKGRQVGGAFKHWKYLAENQRDMQKAIDYFRRIFDRSFHKKVRAAFLAWFLQTHKERTDDIMSGLKNHFLTLMDTQSGKHNASWVRMKNKKDKALFCWRWSREVHRMSKQKWAKLDQDKSGYLKKMESTMVDLKSEHEEDAVWSETMTQEIKALQERVSNVKKKQQEDALDMSRQKKHDAAWSIYRIVQASLSRKLFRAMRVWQVGAVGKKHEDLESRLYKKVKQSDLAVKRITKLVQRAQQDHMQTEKLLSSIRDRTQAIRESTSEPKPRKSRTKSKIKSRRSSPPRQTTTLPSGGMIRLHRSGSVDIRFPSRNRVLHNHGASPMITPGRDSTIHKSNLVDRSNRRNEGTEHFRLPTQSSRSRSISPARVRATALRNEELGVWSPPGNNPSGSHWQPKRPTLEAEPGTADEGSKRGPVFLLDNRVGEGPSVSNVEASNIRGMKTSAVLRDVDGSSSAGFKFDDFEHDYNSPADPK